MNDDAPDDGSDPPEDLPAPLAEALEESSDRQLRATIDHAHRLLASREDRRPDVKARPGEEIVRTHDHDEYTVAVVRHAGDAAPGEELVAYRVTSEPSVEGEEALRWHYLGRVER